jgi:hypothetical protein
MWERILVFLVVALATIYVMRRLYLDTKGHGCDGCAEKKKASTDLIQIGYFDKKRP